MIHVDHIMMGILTKYGLPSFQFFCIQYIDSPHILVRFQTDRFQSRRYHIDTTDKVSCVHLRLYTTWPFIYDRSPDSQIIGRLLGWPLIAISLRILTPAIVIDTYH